MPATEIEALKAEVFPAESLLVGLFWLNPDYYNLYPNDKLSSKSFLNPIWRFYFGLGRKMSEKKVSVYDDISAYKTVTECGVVDDFSKYNGYATIKELMDEVKGSQENFDSYYEEVVKYALIKELIELFGLKVIKPNGKYHYKLMNADDLYHYWNDKLNQVVKNVDNSYEVFDLLDGLENIVRDIEENPDVGLPFFKSRNLSRVCLGWAKGTLYLNAGFSGQGKTSFMLAKVVLSCIENNEKLVIIANEEGLKEFRRNLVITLVGNVTNAFIVRQKFLEGGFKDEEKQKIQEAVEWVKSICGDTGLIKLVALDNYTVSNVKKVITHYANRGYERFVIDTGKPGDDVSGDDGARWQKFTSEVKDIHKIIKADGGGLNVGMWINVQLADSEIYRRFLDKTCLGDAKKIKNEAGFLGLGRHMWDDEYEGGDSELLLYKYVQSPINPEGKATKKSFTVPKFYKDPKAEEEYENHYYLYFIGKNRRGKDNDTGQHALVFRVDWNRNRWWEEGFAIVPRTISYKPRKK